jgi:hypothetical protein
MRLTVYFPEDNPMTHELVGAKLTVGRLGDNDLQLDDASVSSRHAEIEAGDSPVLRDLGSTNGTYLNGEQITGEHALAEGDEIYFGSIRTVFMEPAGTTAPAPVAEPAAVAIEADASGGGRPANFHRMSALPPVPASRDTMGLVAWVGAGLGGAAALYALIVMIVG